MSHDSFEHFDDGSWEDRVEPEWGEADWRRYLTAADREVFRFLNFYRRFRRFPEHLDLTAHLMGWDTAEWEPDEAFLATPVGRLFEQLRTSPESSSTEMDQPLTAHRHPVFIAARGLVARLRALWDMLLRNHPAAREDGIFSWSYANGLNRAEMHSILGAQSLDLGDLELAICHFKDTLAAVNELLRLVQSRSQAKNQVFAVEATDILFDLREVCLRVLSECREDIAGEHLDGDDDEN